MGTSGEPIKLYGPHVKQLEEEFGPISSNGTVSFFTDPDNRKAGGIPIVKAVIEVGAMQQGKILNEPGHVNFGELDESWMNEFMLGNFDKCNDVVDEIMLEGIEITGGQSYDPLTASERNTEFSLFNIQTTPLHAALCEFEKVTLVNPTKGSISRIGKSKIVNRCEEVLLPVRGFNGEYLKECEAVCNEYKIKCTRIDNKFKGNPDKLYYASFNIDSVHRYSLTNYIYCAPNPYQIVMNDTTTAINYNDSGYSISHNRSGSVRQTTNLFEEKNKCIVGADSLYESHKNSREVRGGIMHDVHCSGNYSTYKVPIIYGSTAVTNAMCLIGDYLHNDNYIYKNNGSVEKVIVHFNDGYTMASKPKGEWVGATTRNIQIASYVIGIFSSVAVFLGRKIFFKKNPRGKHSYDGVNYSYCSPEESDLVFVHDLGGKYPIVENGQVNYYAKVPLIPIVPELHHVFGNSAYCYGTYTTIIRNNTPVIKLVNFGESVDDENIKALGEELFADNVNEPVSVKHQFRALHPHSTEGTHKNQELNRKRKKFRKEREHDIIESFLENAFDSSTDNLEEKVLNSSNQITTVREREVSSLDSIVTREDLSQVKYKVVEVAPT